MPVTTRRLISLELLRQEARDELQVVIDIRCRQGDDPWDFMWQLPTVDEQVVATLRADALAEGELQLERARAHHPTASAQHARDFEYRVLRQIALDFPPLSTAVWRMLGRVERPAE
ncbi:hypothetical protein [Planctomonas psychrotolerans]|uniref:hypothetical protein n=1 Tax=Planctomonas psychrotolerans TaxID=2528712 RepID=UPI00123C28C5|nr:hypothetical protein [Planctomonas psychrotolerans]